METVEKQRKIMNEQSNALKFKHHIIKSTNNSRN